MAPPKTGSIHLARKISSPLKASPTCGFKIDGCLVSDQEYSVSKVLSGFDLINRRLGSRRHSNPGFLFIPLEMIKLSRHLLGDQLKNSPIQRQNRRKESKQVDKWKTEPASKPFWASNKEDSRRVKTFAQRSRTHGQQDSHIKPYGLLYFKAGSQGGRLWRRILDTGSVVAL